MSAHQNIAPVPPKTAHPAPNPTPSEPTSSTSLPQNTPSQQVSQNHPIPLDKKRPTSGEDNPTEIPPKPDLRAGTGKPANQEITGQKAEPVTPSKIKSIITLLFLLGFFSLAILGALYAKDNFF